jgi:hypothetical protein
MKMSALIIPSASDILKATQPEARVAIPIRTFFTDLNYRWILTHQSTCTSRRKNSPAATKPPSPAGRTTKVISVAFMASLCVGLLLDESRKCSCCFGADLVRGCKRYKFSTCSVGRE